MWAREEEPGGLTAFRKGPQDGSSRKGPPEEKRKVASGEAPHVNMSVSEAAKTKECVSQVDLLCYSLMELD